jgi:hypothetical protein
MFPHERSLVERHSKAPFVLLGVNLDPQRDLMNKTIEKDHINWRNWWDGDDARIAKKWRVEGLPTLFVIDHKGIIRHVHLGAPDSKDLDHEIEKLIREAQSSETS